MMFRSSSISFLWIIFLSDWGGGTRRWCFWIDEMTFFEDGTGKHAVTFNIGHDGTDWGNMCSFTIKTIRG